MSPTKHTPDSGHPTAKQIEEKEKEVKANVEATQRQASLRSVTPGDATTRVNASVSGPDTGVAVLGGYAVPQEAEQDVPGSETRVFYDGPSLDANVITPTVGNVVTTEVWEGVYQNNATNPTFILRASPGQVLKVSPGDFLMMQDFGPH